jgi:spore germination protein YaaH
MNMMITKSVRRAAGAVATVLALTASLFTVVTAPAHAEPSRVVSGWFGYWTPPQDMISIAKSSHGVLGEVNIFWWRYAGTDKPICTSLAFDSCQATGASPWTTAHFSEALAGLHALGITVYATHTDLDGNRARSLAGYLAGAANRESLATKMTEWVVKSGVDGVDLDWENFAFNDGSSTWATTKPRFVKTIQLLATKLHAAGKKLSVTVPGGYQPFLSNGQPNPGGGYTVYAWAEIAPYVDRLRLMTYDYSWNRPGPIGPDAWTRSSVRSAIAQVGAANKSKIYVGVHSYGKAWYVRDSGDNVAVVGACKPGWKPTGSDAINLTPTEARALAATYKVSPRFDNATKEWTFRYQKTENGTWTTASGSKRSKSCTVTKEVWFGGAETAVARAQMVKEYGIGGLVVWQLASLDPNFFSSLAKYAHSGRALGSLGTLKATASTKRPKVGSKMSLTGQLSPVAASVKVKRQSYVNGSWRNRGFVRTNAAGTALFTIQMPKQSARYKFRLTAKTPDTKRIYSSTVKVRSKGA